MCALQILMFGHTRSFCDRRARYTRCGRASRKEDAMVMLHVEARLIPMSYVARWLALLSTRDVPAEQALAGTGISPDAAADPGARISLDALVRLLQAGEQLTADPSLGLELGLAMKPNSHGWLGYAMMSCSTLRQACELGTRYLSVRASPWRVHVFVEGDTAVMQFDENVALGR